MNTHELIAELRESSSTKIVLLVADGLGGLPIERGGKTELETANTPNLDRCAAEGVCGLSTPVLPGITPGSGPGHLGLFGYDPLEYRIGRGILEALGIHFSVGPKDVAVRGNFCTLDRNGLITDRRAGRPTTERCIAMVEKMRTIRIPGVELFVEPVKEHRFVVVFRADGLGDSVNDTDPQAIGVPPLKANGADEASSKTALLVNQFIAEACKVLAGDAPNEWRNSPGFRPLSKDRNDERGLRPASSGDRRLSDVQGTSQTGGDGRPRRAGFAGGAGGEDERSLGQVRLLLLALQVHRQHGRRWQFPGQGTNDRALDSVIPDVLVLKPDVLIVTGDHSTPSKLQSHSWHPVPTLLWADTCRPDGVTRFGETACIQGGLGQFQAKHLMLLAMAHAGRLGKYGA